LGREATEAQSAHPNETRIYRAFLRPSPSLPKVCQAEATDSELRAAAAQLQGFHR